MTTRTISDEDKSPEKLEREVDQVRARLGRTVNELSDRLSPGELLDQAMHMAREHGGEFGRNLGSQVKHNPLPLLLTGVGITWLMLSPSDSNRARYGYQNSDYEDWDAASESKSDLERNLRSEGDDEFSEKSAVADVKEVLGNAAERTRRIQEGVGKNFHSATQNVQKKLRTSSETATHLFQENPLVAGALGIAFGAVLGALVPPTVAEDRALGDLGDKLKDKVNPKWLSE